MKITAADITFSHYEANHRLLFGPWPNMPVTQFIVPEPEEGKYFGILLHDQFTAHWKFAPRSKSKPYVKNPPFCALPETVPLYGVQGDFVDIGEAGAWQIFQAMKEVTGWSDARLLGEFDDKEGYPDLIADHKAFTDRHAIQTPDRHYYDIVTRQVGTGVVPKPHAPAITVSMDSTEGKQLMKIAKPYMWKTIAMAGNLVLIIGDHNDFHVIDAINFSDLPAFETTWGKPWLWHAATQSCYQFDKDLARSAGVLLPDGRWCVLNFPQCRPFGTYVPIASETGYLLVKKDRVARIDPGTVFSPYIP